MDNAKIQELIDSTKLILDQLGHTGSANAYDTQILPEPPLVAQIWLTGKAQIDPGQLADPETLARFTEAVHYVVQADWVPGAFELQRYLEDSLLPANARLRTTQPQVYEQYATLVAVLKFLNLGAIGLPKAYELVGKYIVTVLEWQINLQDTLELRLEREADFILGGEIAQGFADAIANSPAKFGNITFTTPDGRQVAATIGSWIKEYIRYGQSTAEHKTGPLQRTEFLRKNKELQKLTKEDQGLLTKIFELYDWLMYGGDDGETRLDLLIGPDADELPVPIAPQGRLTPLGKPAGIAQVAPLPVGRPQPKPVPPPAQSKLPARAQPPLAKLSNVIPPPFIPKPPPFLGGKSTSPINVQELINRAEKHAQGSDLPFGNNSGVDNVSRGFSLGQGKSTLDLDKIKKDVDAKRLQSQTDIDKKLEALKKRRQV